MKLLIINADDYGIAPSVSQGILQAYEQQAVSSTTIMSNLATDEEMYQLRASGLPFGVHVNLTAGKPLTSGAPKSLVNDQGALVSVKIWDRDRSRRFRITKLLLGWIWAGSFWCRVSAGSITSAERRWLKEEMQAQIDRVTLVAGRPSHLDSHHHIHRHPVIFEVFVECARATNIGLRPMEQWQAEAMRKQGVRCPDAITRLPVRKAPGSMAHFKAVLNREKITSLEVICHPGHASDILRGRDTLVAKREVELALLVSPDVRKMIGESGYTLGHYGQLARGVLR